MTNRRQFIKISSASLGGLLLGGGMAAANRLFAPGTDPEKLMY